MRRFLSAFLLVLSACSAREGYQSESYSEIKVEDLANDIRIPTRAWDLLEGKAEEPAETGEHESAVTPNKEFVFAEIVVFLKEKNPGVLRSPAIKILLPRGGGEIDLADYMGISPGTFFVGFEFPEFTEATEKKVLFVSRARKRRVDEVVFGAGCNQFFDISKKFFEQMKSEGVKVNTTRERHLSVLGGTFLFSAIKGNTVYVSQVSFTDSKHTHLFCEGR